MGNGIELFSQDSEQSLFSILLAHPELIYNLQTIKPFMFSSTVHTGIFSTMLELMEQNLVPDKTLVISKLAQTGRLEACGGEGYIKHLESLNANVGNLKAFEESISSSYKARTIVNAVGGVTEKILSGGNVQEQIESLRGVIDNLELVAGGESTQQIDLALKDTWDSIVTRVNNPGVRGTITGFNSIDIQTGGISGGDVWIIASRPGMGKSAHLCNSALNTAKAGNPVLIFSLEMRKQSIIERMLAFETGISITDIRLGTLTQVQLDNIAKALKLFKGLPIYIDCSFMPSLSYVVATIRRYHKMYGIKIVYLDYLQLLAERGDNQTAELGNISRTFKLLMNELDAGAILYSQLNRLVEARPDKRPVLSDIRQSGNLEEDADIVAFLYRDDYYDPQKNVGLLEYIMRKNRNGPTGTIFLAFDANTNRITG